MEIFKQSQAWGELKENKRLQWLIFVVLCILLLSFGKRTSDANSDLEAQLLSQVNLLGRLESAAQFSFDEQSKLNLEQAYLASIEVIPVVASESIAEAQALSRLKKSYGDIVVDGRSILVNTERLVWGDQEFWQVRAEQRGKIKPENMFQFLQSLDGSDPAIRLNSMRYREGRKQGSIVYVVDFLFRKQEVQ